MLAWLLPEYGYPVARAVWDFTPVCLARTAAGQGKGDEWEVL